MKKILCLCLVISILLLHVTPALAQSAGPRLVSGTVALDEIQQAALLGWISANPPAETDLYAPTYLQNTNGSTYISFVALRPDLPEPYAWTLTDSPDVLWMGTILIDPAGNVTPFGLAAEPTTGAKLAAPARLPPGGDGGGANIALPWQAGTAMVYGPRGVHGLGDYSTSGMYAVDWVSGDNLGNNAAPPSVYASASGEVDYVCDDGTSVAVRVTDGNDSFVYAHLLENDNLINAHEFNKNELLGSLKYGSFSDNCGWAQQASNHYHVHWMFKPRNSYFQAEGWVLNLGSGVWSGPGGAEVRVNQSLVGGGGSYSEDGSINPADDGLIGEGTQAGTGAYIWDFLLGGVATITLTTMDSFLYKRGAYGGETVDDPLSGAGCLNCPTATPSPVIVVTGHSPGGINSAVRPQSAETYWAGTMERARTGIHQVVLILYIFAVAFPSMNIMIFLITVIVLALFAFIVWCLRIMNIIGEFWRMLKPPFVP